jgi:hypothetical protein
VVKDLPTSGQISMSLSSLFFSLFTKGVLLWL